MTERLPREGAEGGDDGRGEEGSPAKLPLWKHVLGVLLDTLTWVVCVAINLIACLYNNGSTLKLPSSSSELKASFMKVGVVCKWLGRNKSGPNVTGPEEKPERHVLDILPKELWPLVEEKIEDSKDWLSFIRVSPEFEKLMGHKKTEKLFPEVLKHILGSLTTSDMLNLRLVNKSFKQAFDNQWLDTNYYPTYSTTIFLTDLKKISRFTKEMISSDTSINTSLSLIPFDLVIGLGSPTDPDYEHWRDEFMDKLTVQVFWKAVTRFAEKLGPRIASVSFDIRINPQYGLKFAEEIVSIIVHECLKNLPNLRFLDFFTNTTNVEKALSSIYSIKDPDLSQFPSLSKLECVEIVTVGEGHPSKSKFKTRSITFPSRFLRLHSHTIRSLRVFSNLYDFKTMGVFQAPALEKIQYEIHHCLCQGKDAELKALLLLPVIEQGEAKQLKTVIVKVNWQWRTSDFSSVFKWLGRNYPMHQFEAIVLRNTENPFKSMDLPDHHHHQHSYETDYRGSRQLPKKVNAYGSDFPWLSKIAIPPIKKLELYTEYDGSWEFLRAIRGDLESLLMLKQGFFRNEDGMKDKFKRGIVQEIFGEEAVVVGKAEKAGKKVVVWDYFPKLKEIVLVWYSINYKYFNWDIEVMVNSEEYKKKEIVKKMQFKVTREDYRQFCRLQQENMLEA